MVEQLNRNISIHNLLLFVHGRGEKRKQRHNAKDFAELQCLVDQFHGLLQFIKAIDNFSAHLWRSNHS